VSENLSNSLHDVSAVRTVIAAYIEGSKKCCIQTLKPLFHPQAVMTGVMVGTYDFSSPQPFFDELDGVPKDDCCTDYSAEILSIDVFGAIATATIKEQNLLGLNYVNAFHLVKSEGAWLITSKIYQTW